MNNEEVTTVAADFMYLIMIGEPEIMERVAVAMNSNTEKNGVSKFYVSVDIDTPLDNLPETPLFQKILINGCSDMRNIQNMRNIGGDTQKQHIGVKNNLADSEFSEDSNLVTEVVEAVEDLQSSDYISSKKYYVMGEGVETAQCHTYGEGYTNVSMLIEIEDDTEYFTITFPILNLDDEVNPEDLISNWILKNNLSHVADNLNIRLVNMVGTNHDILVFAAYINRTAS